MGFASIYAVDFETTYKKGERDISSLGVLPYVEHPQTELYMVSLVGPGIRYSGSIEEAPWGKIDGHHWISHNAAFDSAVFMEAVRRGQIPNGIGPCEWDCTANMAVYLGAGRSLAAAAQGLLGRTLSKAVRDEMNGKTRSSMSDEFWKRACDYALTDSDVCYDLWMHCSGRWPELERQVSRHTMKMTRRGIAIDMPKTLESIRILEAALFETCKEIPWANELDAKGKEIPIMSPTQIKKRCVELGIPPPSTTADKSEIFDAWADEWSDQAPFVAAVKDYRSINRSLEILYKFRDQTRKDGRLSYSLKYGGAHTLRFSGDAGLNFQNFTKEPLMFDANYKRVRDESLAVYSVNLRHHLIAGKGKKLVILDFKQIEAIVALWLVEDREQLAMIAGGMDCYEAHARRSMGYNQPMSLKDYCAQEGLPPAEKNKRQFAKCRRLGLGFGLGKIKFKVIVKQWSGIDITLAEADAIVTDFRTKERGFPRMWGKLGTAMRQHAHDELHKPENVARIAKQEKPIIEPFTLELPSGRLLHYFNPTVGEDSLKCQTEIGGPMLYFYGGKLFENLVQAIARDILVYKVLAIEDLVGAANPEDGVVLHVHDEPIVEVDETFDSQRIADVMSADLDWVPGLPIGVDWHESSFYLKA